MGRPRMVITGASGFIGRALLETFKDSWIIHGLGRRSQVRSGAAIHPNIRWYQLDICDRERLGRVFGEIRAGGPVEVVIHLAAHYDFTGQDDPEYWRTNVDGLRAVLDECRLLAPELFVFASSVAGCSFPPEGSFVDERSPLDGDHVYAVTKRIGEEMLEDYAGCFRPVIVRFAALFSDWCEYPPLYAFLSTWLRDAWNARMLAGRGRSAIPYLHVRDVQRFFRRLVGMPQQLDPLEVLLCSGHGATTHLELFEMATLAWFGERRRPLLVPRPLCWLGLWTQDLAGRLLGERPFERPWMARYIDRQLNVDPRRTWERLGWRPREWLEVTRRLPFLLANLKTEPEEWHRRNRAAMKHVAVRPNLVIHRLLEKHKEEIRERFTAYILDPARAGMFPHYREIPRERLAWRHQLALRHLANAVLTTEKTIFINYCRDLAERRREQGFPREEFCAAMRALGDLAVEVIRRDPEARGLEQALHDHVTMTILFGCDEIRRFYEDADLD